MSAKSVSGYWDKQYTSGPNFEGIGSDRPSSAVVRFVDYLKAQKIPLEGNVLGIGCGVGRSENWLASLGFVTHGVDISKVAIARAKMVAKNLGVGVDFRVADISKRLPYKNQSMVYIVDLFSSPTLLLKDFKKYLKEAKRVLKKNGMVLFYASERSVDKQAKKLLKESPGPEKNTYKFEDGLVERAFTLDELKTFWHPLTVEKAELLSVSVKYRGKIYKRKFWWVILKK